MRGLSYGALLSVCAAVTTLLTAFTHSYFGERQAHRAFGGFGRGVMAHALAKQVVRFAWHLTTLLWIGQALLLLRAASAPYPPDRVLAGGIGVLYIAVGLFDAILTRGRHIGWPLLTAIGIFSLLSLV